MLDTQHEQLVEAAGEALEAMAFMFVMPLEETLPIPEESVQVEMSFTGPMEGKVCFRGGTDFVSLIAVNALGLEPGDEGAQGKGVDAFKELLNTTCGLLLPKMASSLADVFHVTVPEATTYDTEVSWREFVQQAGTVVVDVDGEPLAMRMELGSGA